MELSYKELVKNFIEQSNNAASCCRIEILEKINKNDFEAEINIYKDNVLTESGVIIKNYNCKDENIFYQYIYETLLNACCFGFEKQRERLISK